MSVAFKNAWENRGAIAREWKGRQGKVLGMFNSLIPEEMVHAAGLMPVEIISLDKSIANSRKYLPEFLCPYLKDCLEQALEGELSYLDGVAIAHACESLRGFFGVWKKNAGLVDPFFLQVPATASDGARNYFTQELKNFKIYLERISGKEISDDALHAAISAVNENRGLLKRLYELREKKDSGISGSDVVNVIKARLVIPVDRHTEMLKTYLDQVEKSPPVPDSEKKARLTIISNCVLESATVSEMVEAVGGRIVADNLCYGLRCCWEAVEDGDDPLEAIAGHYLTKIPCPGKFPMDVLSDYLTGFVTKSDSDGMIWIIDKFCDPYLFQYPLLMDSIKEKEIKIISLEDGDIKNTGRLKLKLEAFIEMLQSDGLIY